MRHAAIHNQHCGTRNGPRLPAPLEPRTGPWIRTIVRPRNCLLPRSDPRSVHRLPTVGGRSDDRPYVASSFLSVAISEVFGTTLGGRSKDRPELAAQSLPFEVRIAVLPSRAGERLIRELSEPLGYEVTVERLALDPNFPDCGPSRYYSVSLSGDQRLQDLLSHPPIPRRSRSQGAISNIARVLPCRPPSVSQLTPMPTMMHRRCLSSSLGLLALDDRETLSGREKWW